MFLRALERVWALILAGSEKVKEKVKAKARGMVQLSGTDSGSLSMCSCALHEADEKELHLLSPAYLPFFLIPCPPCVRWLARHVRQSDP